MYKIDNNHQRWGWLCADNHNQKEMVMHKISNYTTIKIENLKHVQHTITKCRYNTNMCSNTIHILW
jgi:hypothetical protein